MRRTHDGPDDTALTVHMSADHVSAATDRTDVVIAEDQLSQDDTTPLTCPLPCLRDRLIGDDRFSAALVGRQQQQSRERQLCESFSLG
jgi:hypothetical protein